MDYEKLVVWIMRTHYYSETGARKLLGEMQKAKWILIERVRETERQRFYAVTKITIRTKSSQSSKKKAIQSKQGGDKT